jgi:hypothetical protein
MRPEELFTHFEGPALPEGLRLPVLAAAAAALLSEPVADRWARIWQSTAWRLAWAACAVLLLAGHLVLSLHGPAAHHPATSRVNGELAAIADLAPLRLDLEPASAIYAALVQSNDTNQKEPRS